MVCIMFSSSTARVRGNYDRLSRWYDWLAGASERTFGLAGVRGLAPRPGERVLEIGSGTGAMLAELGRRVAPTGATFGIDLSAGMCRVARARLTRAGPTLRAAVVCGDVMHLPCATGAFDAIFMSFTLELFADAEMPRLLDECRRVLRADGRLGVVALAATDRPGPMTRLYAWAHRRFPAIIDCRPIPVATILAASGFQVVEIHRGSLWGLPIEIVLADLVSR